MDDYQKLTDMDILETFESLKKELMTELSKLSESSRDETDDLNRSEIISTGSTELECYGEVDLTTSQKNTTEEYNSSSDFSNSSSSLKTENTNSEKTSVLKYGICKVGDICKNELDNFGPVPLSDENPDIIRNVNMAEQSVVCKSEVKKEENTFNWEENKFDKREKNKISFLKREYLKEEEIVKQHHDEILTIKTEEENMINLADMDFKYPVNNEDANSRKKGGNVILPDLTTICGNPPGIICAEEVVDGGVKNQQTFETNSMCCNKKTMNTSVTLIRNDYKIITNEKENIHIKPTIKERSYPFNCAHCGQSFTKKVHLISHIKKHNKYILLQGKPCKKRITQEIKLKQKISHEGIDTYKCPKCKKRFTQSGNLKVHLRSHNGDRPYECPVCKKRFFVSCHLKVHMRIHEGTRPYQCPQCQKKFIQSGSLKAHLRIHEGIRPYECPKCKKKFRQKSTLNVHLRIHNGTHPYECPQCSKKFAYTGSLKMHLRIHKGVRPYECPQCKKRFTANGDLKIHLRIHEGIRPYECPQCKKKFTTSSHLKKHLRIHEGVRPYECPRCKKRFAESSKLKLHLRIHEGIRPYECPECKKKFTDNGSLKKHLRIHEEVPPYGCPQCKKRFTYSAALKVHLRIHEGIRPYECRECKKKFTQSGNLKQHLRIHDRKRPYECT